MKYLLLLPPQYPLHFCLGKDFSKDYRSCILNYDYIWRFYCYKV